MFNIYLLVRLLQRKQVVLFSPDGVRGYLFYDKVYSMSLNDVDADISLPRRLSPTNFIWSLFDMQEKKEPKRFMVTLPCIPVQTASPDPVQYKMWDKRENPLLTGLPLWTPDELEKGYVITLQISLHV